MVYNPIERALALSAEDLLREPAGLDDVHSVIKNDVIVALELAAADLGAAGVDIFFRDPRGRCRWFAGSKPSPALDPLRVEGIFECSALYRDETAQFLSVPIDGVAGDYRLVVAGPPEQVQDGDLARAVLTARFCLRTVRGTRLLANVEARADSMTAVTEMLSVVLQSNSVPEVLGILAQQVAEATKSTSVAIDSYDLDSGQLARNLYTDPSWPDWQAGAERWRELLEVRLRSMSRVARPEGQSVGLLAEWKQPWVIPDLQHPAIRPFISDEEAEFFRRFGVRTTVLQPLWVTDIFVGVLSVANREVRRYSRGELEILSRMSDVAAVAIRAAQLMRELRVSKARERDAYMENIARLAAAAEARDHTTARHLENLQHWVGLMGQRLVGDEARVREIVLASRMHDIGKISVPDSILLKPGRLTPEEREVIRRHTLDGESLLSGSYLSTAREVARWHHERWDGKGYPDGLSGEDIPLSARIVSVADVYDALISNRPYKNAWTPEDALAEIQKGAGSQFDPRVTEVFFEVWREDAAQTSTA
ncbi:MAG TPA: HD domain-containing phosphohydrolase [Dehalococcoidia bacterium]|nr:HD domain-containing phosphohydrolase [Dehalococcoidia bacterium]